MLNRDCIIVRIPCLIYVVLGNILLNLWSFLSILKTIKYTGYITLVLTTLMFRFDFLVNSESRFVSI
jgi:hypothetical protein